MFKKKEDLVLNEKREESRDRYVKSQLSYHTVGKYKNKQHLNDPKPNRTPSSVYVNTSEQITECMKEANLKSRIILFEKLLPVVHGASKPYIEFLIRKYTSKLHEQKSALENTSFIDPNDPFGDRL